jgi:hypothetical protein
MDRKGFMATITVVITLIISGIIIASFQPLIIGKAKINQHVENYTTNKINSRNGLERLYSMYSQDISANLNELSYEDLGISYEIEEIEKDTRQIIKAVNNRGSFFINNKTTLNVRLDFIDRRISEDDFAYYSFDIKHDGESIFEENIINEALVGSGLEINIEIDEEYGDYEVFYSTHNMDIDVTVEYTEQSYRKLRIIENNKKERIIIIENNVELRTLNKFIEL